MLLRDRSGKRCDLIAKIVPELLGRARRFGEGLLQQAELRSESLGPGVGFGSCRRVRRFRRRESVDLRTELIRYALDPETDLVDPAVEAGDLGLAAGNTTGSLADDPGQRPDSRSERLDRVEETVHPLGQHRVDLELRLEDIEVSTHGTQGALGASERLFAAPLEIRKRLGVTLLEGRQLAVRRRHLPRRGGRGFGNEVDPVDEDADLLVDSLLEGDVRRNRSGCCEGLRGLLRYRLEPLLDLDESRLGACVLFRECLGELRRPVLLADHTTRSRANDLAQRVDSNGELRDRFAQRVGGGLDDLSRPVGTVGNESSKCFELPAQGSEVGGCPIGPLTAQFLQTPIERGDLTTARRHPAGRLAHHGGKRVDPLRERVERLAQAIGLWLALSAHRRVRAGGDVYRHRTPQTPQTAPCRRSTAGHSGRASSRDEYRSRATRRLSHMATRLKLPRPRVSLARRPPLRGAQHLSLTAQGG